MSDGDILPEWMTFEELPLEVRYVASLRGKRLTGVEVLTLVHGIPADQLRDEDEYVTTVDGQRIRIPRFVGGIE